MRQLAVASMVVLYVGSCGTDDTRGPSGDLGTRPPDATTRTDAPVDGGPRVDGPVAPDGTSTDATSTDAFAFDTGLASCATHWACTQGAFCYYGKCLTDQQQPVYHCGKPGCPPGHWCIDQAGQRGSCSEDASYACGDACDCGPAHCCIDVPSAGGKRCVKDLTDPAQPGGTLLDPGVTCAKGQNADSTYCCEDDTCSIGRASYGSKKKSFRCHARGTPPDTPGRDECGGMHCFGTACLCSAGESCVDTATPGAPVGSTCGLLTGGSCVSNAAAEVVFGFKPSEILACCASGCTAAGQACDAGWRSGGTSAYARVQGVCGSCGNGQCEVWESPERCAQDCSCGDGQCSVSEAVFAGTVGQSIVSTCPADCGVKGNATCDALESIAGNLDCILFDSPCGNGACEAEHGETPGTCPADCASICADGVDYPGVYRFCGDKVCGDGDKRALLCGGQETESCVSCVTDCGPCAWRKREHSHPALANRLRGMWGFSTGEAFAVGSLGTILHYDGLSWQPMGTGTTQTLSGVWGSSANDVFAVGDAGTALRFDGLQWQAMTTGTSKWLTGVWGSSANDVFAVGNGGTIVRYDGQSWQPMASTTSESLFGVWGSSATNVLAVGSAGTILRYDGSSWTPMISGTAATLFDVTGSSPSAVFAVGAGGTLLRFDGQSWQAIATGVSSSLHAVWSSSATTVFAAGVSSTLGPAGGPLGLILRLDYDGQSWQASSWEMEVQFESVWGSSITDVFVGNIEGTLLHYDGQGWQRASGVDSGAAREIEGVWGSSSSNLFAVGHRGDISRYDGSAWQRMPSTTPHNLTGVWGSAASDVFAVGEYGTIVHYDGQSWTTMPSGSGAWLYGVWGTSASDVFAVGFDLNSKSAAILRFDGQSWKPMTSGSSAMLRGVWGTSANDVFAVGYDFSTAADGAVLHYDGQSWQEMPSGTTAQLHAVWGSSPTNVFAVGYQGSGAAGTIMHYDGQSWQPMALPPVTRLRRLWGSSATDVYAVTGNSMLHFDGQSWRFDATDLREESALLCNGLRAIGGTLTNDLFVVGNYGLLLERCPFGNCGPGATSPTCPNGACDLGESCDGRSATLSCPQDCPGVTSGTPSQQYCVVNGVCQGAGCP